MAEPFLAEIRLASFVFAPKGWALCNGQLLAINQNQALFSILGTTYGGDGRVNFALPDLRRRVPIHMGNGHTLGELGGEDAHTISVGELAAHTHDLRFNSGDGNSQSPVNNVFARESKGVTMLYGTQVGSAMSTQLLANAGGSTAHENRQPFLCLSFIIALQGIFPS
jgi:microcystin-dependent protein